MKNSSKPDRPSVPFEQLKIRSAFSEDRFQPAICCLEYSEAQRLFHFGFVDEDRKNVHKNWVIIASVIDEIDAEKFVGFMYKKYVDGRVTGTFPSLDIVRLELELFFKLKNVRRKLI